MDGELLVREGTNTVGIQFVGTRAVYNGRGWIRQLKMLRGGPEAFSLYFNNTKVASTTNGVIAEDNFTTEALYDLRMKTLVHDKAAFLQGQGYVNATGVGVITLIADTPPDRQNYYIEQTWAQVFRKKTNTNTLTDMDLEEVPCLTAYNLRSQDTTAKIQRTFIHPDYVRSDR